MEQLYSFNSTLTFQFQRLEACQTDVEKITNPRNIVDFKTVLHFSASILEA
jgi:hypothetical protein